MSLVIRRAARHVLPEMRSTLSRAYIRVLFLQWPLWKQNVTLTQEYESLEYKYVKLRGDGTIGQWEPVENRRISLANMKESSLQLFDGDFGRKNIDEAKQALFVAQAKQDAAEAAEAKKLAERREAAEAALEESRTAAAAAASVAAAALTESRSAAVESSRAAAAAEAASVAAAASAVAAQNAAAAASAVAAQNAAAVVHKAAENVFALEEDALAAEVKAPQKVALYSTKACATPLLLLLLSVCVCVCVRARVCVCVCVCVCETRYIYVGESVAKSLRRCRAGAGARVRNQELSGGQDQGGTRSAGACNKGSSRHLVWRFSESKGLVSCSSGGRRAGGSNKGSSRQHTLVA